MDPVGFQPLQFRFRVGPDDVQRPVRIPNFMEDTDQPQGSLVVFFAAHVADKAKGLRSVVRRARFRGSGFHSVNAVPGTDYFDVVNSVQFFQQVPVFIIQGENLISFRQVPGFGFFDLPQFNHGIALFQACGLLNHTLVGLL